MLLSAQECVAVLASLAATVSDVRTRRIPNILSIGLVAFGITAQAITGGIAGGAAAIALVALVFLIGSFVFARGWLGGGDVKLAAGCIACLGPQQTADFLLFTGIAGGVLSLAVALRERRVLAVLNNLRFGFVYGGGQIQTSATTNRLPYAIAIFAGTLATVAFRFAPSMRLPL